MLTIVESIAHAIDDFQQRRNATTFQTELHYFRELSDLADSMKIVYPTQALFDSFFLDSKKSSSSKVMHTTVARMVDRWSLSLLCDAKGEFLNEPPLPDIESTRAYFSALNSGSVDLSHLIVYAIEKTEHCKHTASTNAQLLHEYYRLRCYCYQNGIFDYDEDAISSYLALRRHQVSTGELQKWRLKIAKKVCSILHDVFHNGSYTWHLIKAHPCFKDIELDRIREEYVAFLQSQNLAKGTIELREFVFRKSLEIAGVNTAQLLKTLSESQIQTVTQYYSTHFSQSSVSTIFPVFRSILEYLFETGYVSKNYSYMVIQPLTHRNHVRSFISVNEEQRLLKELPNLSFRDRAIILLLLRNALRNVDVINLLLTDIDWKNDQIKIIQKKTGVAMIHPLLPDVGNAIFDYINNERPETDCQYLFLRKQAPHMKLSDTYGIVSRIFKRLDIKSENYQRYGPHVFRYTLTKRLIDINVPQQVITETLGHTSSTSDIPYLSIDENKLRRCALDLSIIGRPNWNGEYL